MSRVYNFSAGPAILPEPVLEQARDELLDWHGSGMSIMEVSHRGKIFSQVAAQAEQDLRSLLGISDDFAVLFMQGGATLQFALLPMNLAPDANACYVQTGSWSKKAIAEARRFCKVSIVADTSDNGFTGVPPQARWQSLDSAAYLHYCMNETIHGVEFPFIPETGEVPLVADCSSTLLSRPLQVERFGVIYAGAQKNIGPAGLTIVIIRRDLLARSSENLASMLSYRSVAESDSMLNTPPTFAWYLSGLVFQWLISQGGLEAMAARNQRKADKLYAAVDGSGFYNNPVEVESRSWMNIPFTLADAQLDAEFLKQSEAEGLCNLKGHRSVGGMRASIYNAMPEAGVDALVSFMSEFERKFG